MLLYILILAFCGFIQNCNSVAPIVDQAQVNHSPVIINLKTNQDIITPLGNCQISCIALDQDGDNLNYYWLAEAGKINGEGYKIIWTAPDKEGVYSIKTKLSDNEEIVEETIDIIVRKNHPPVINGLFADVKWLKPLEDCHFICRSEDADNDELSYRWNTVNGRINGTGPIIVWTAPPRAGPQDITVIVSDKYGGSAAKLITIKVAENYPPVIEDFIITASEPKYFKEYTDEYKILKGKSCQIECIVNDLNGDLEYTWSAERGELSGEGSLVTWVAPGVKGIVNITLIVTDIAGNMTEETIVFKVETCSCVFE